MLATTLVASQTNVGVRYAKGPLITPAHDAAYWNGVTAGFDFSEADQVPVAQFNRVLWASLKGDTPYPTLRGRLRNDLPRIWLGFRNRRVSGAAARCAGRQSVARSSQAAWSRKVFRLSPFGARVAAVEAVRLADQVATAPRILKRFGSAA